MADLTAESRQEQKLSLAESLRRHWVWLLGVALFPLAALLGVMVLRDHSELFLVLFFVVLTPLWDYTRCRAPYKLWIVAMGIWMASLCLTGLFMPLL
jgi:hypothetical protein